MSGDELAQAAAMWLRGYDTHAIARELRLREPVIYRNLAAIKNAARQIREGASDVRPQSA